MLSLWKNWIDPFGYMEAMQRTQEFWMAAAQTVSSRQWLMCQAACGLESPFHPEFLRMYTEKLNTALSFNSDLSKLWTRATPVELLSGTTVMRHASQIQHQSDQVHRKVVANAKRLQKI